MRLAAIDIGTNSTRLLISEKKNTDLITVTRQMEITRLGKDLKDGGMIGKESAEATSDAVLKYKKIIKEQGVQKVKAVGTSALRRASNRDFFLQMVKEKSGVDVEIIEGREEARLSFLGVMSIDIIGSFKKDILIVDIGGGSTEFILGDKKTGIKISDSIEIGSVRLTELFYPNEKKISELKGFVDEKIKDLTKLLITFELEEIFGLAGTITTLAAVDLGLEKYDRSKIHLYTLNLDKIEDMLKLFLEKSLKDRKNIKGLDPKRADIIIAGTVILIQVMKALGISKITVSENGILDGIIYSMLDFC